MFKRTRTGFWLILLIVAVVGHVLPCRCENLDGGTGDGGVGWFLRAIFGSQAEHQFQSSAGHGRLRRGTSKGCRQTIQADSGYIRSPGFPSSYRPNLLCEWTIQVPARKQILMRFILLDVRGGASGKCTEQEDYLMIRDGTKSGRHLGIFCSPSPNSGQPSPIVSITSKVWIIFHSNEKQSGKGFLISFISVESLSHLDYVANQLTFEPRSGSTEPTPTVDKPEKSLSTEFVPMQRNVDLTTIDLPFESIAFGNPNRGLVQYVTQDGSTVVTKTFSPPVVTELRQQTVADTSRVSLFTTQQRNGFSPSFPSKPILEPHKEQSQSQPFSDTQMKSITEQPLQTPTGDASQPKTGEQTKSPDLSPSVTASQLTRSFMMEPHTAELSTELPRVTLKESYVSTEVPVTASEQTSRMTTKQPLVTTKEQLALSFYGDARSVPTTGQQFTLIKGSPTTSYWNKIDHHTLTGAETLPFTKRQDQTQIRTKPLTDQLNAGEFQTHFTTLSPIFTAKPIEAFTATEQLKSTNSQPLVPPTHYQQPLQTFGKHTTGQQNTGVMPVLTQPRSITQGQSHIEQESTSESVTQRDTQPSTEGHTTHQQVSSPLELFPFGQTLKIITNRGAIPQQELQPSTQIASADQEGILLTKLQLFTRTQKPMRQLTHQQTEADFKPQLLTQTSRPTEQSMSTHQQVGTEPEYQSVTLREHKTLLTQLPLRASNTMTHTRGGGEAQTIKPWDFDTKLDRPSGELQSPNYPDAYPMGVHYRWNITVSPRGVIVLNFTDFDLDSAPNNNSSCDERYAYIKVEDEGGIEHVFCGHKIPPLVVSTLNKLIITFVSSYGYGKGFHALYLMQKTKDRVAPPDVSTSEHVCGGGFHQPSGRIQSPNFPDDFQTGIRCHWNITVDVGQVIIINFTAFDLDSVPVDKWCSERYAHVKIVDGIGGNSWTYCGQELPPVFVSSSNTISITYESEFGYSGGFSAVYSVSQMDRASASTPPKAQIPPLLTTRPLYDCGGYRTASRGVIQSPNLPEELELGVNCKWIITAPVGQHIVLNFTNFVMDSAPIEDGQCDERYSHVKVSEGQTDGTGMKGVFCDQKRPPSVVSSSNILTVTFSSGYGYGYGIGFRAEYFMQEVEDRVVIPDISTSEQMCGGSLYQPSGRIQSPYFPDDFHASISCHWNITVDVGQVIVINFTAFDLDSVPVDDWCSERYAHVKIVDKIGENSSTYCGQELPPVFVSSSNTVSITYISAFGYSGGFSAVYRVSEKDSVSTPASPKVPKPPAPTRRSLYDCGGTLTASRGVLQSPQLSEELDLGINCKWIITAPVGQIIVLNFTNFVMDSAPIEDGQCDERYSHVKVSEGQTDGTGMKGVFCDQKRPPSVVSSSNILTVTFSSGYGYGYGIGFRAEYFMQEVEDRVVIPDISTSEQMCGGSLYQPSGRIQSPYFPDDFHASISCHWNITVDVGQVIVINFTAFDLDSVPVDDWCSERYAHVKIVDKIGENSSTYCGQELPPVFVSSSNTVSITYISEFGYSGGFSAVYRVSEKDRVSTPASPKVPKPPAPTTRSLYDCGGTLTASRGVIQSPQLPEELDLGINCKWIITVPVGQIIVLNFTNFVMDSAPIEDGQCDERYSHVKVSEGQTDGTGMKGVFCDQKRPPSVVSSSNILTVTFSSGYGYGIGFRAEYFMQEVEDRVVIPDISTSEQMCGGSLYQPSGRIQSPYFPDDFQASISCHWNITVQVGQVIVLNFTAFDLDSVPVDDWCSERYAHVKIVDKIGENSSTYCGQKLPPVFVSSSNTVSITYISEFGYSGGFSAVYRASEKDRVSTPASPKVPKPHAPTTRSLYDCGGPLTASRGVIQSPQLPEELELGINCKWIITAPVGQIIVLNFTNFVMDSAPIEDGQCDERYSHVKVSEGQTDGTGMEGIFCDQKRPPSVVSSSNILTVTFSSGYGYGYGIGFRAEYFMQEVEDLVVIPDTSTSGQMCGGSFYQPSGRFQSPNFLDFQTEISCHWNITVQVGQVIVLNFTVFDLDSVSVDDWCSERYAHVKIVDGIGGSSSTYCGQELPPVFISSSNTISIMYISDFGYGGNFLALYTASAPPKVFIPPPTGSGQPDQCGGVLNQPEGVIFSPWLPDNLETSISCVWNITVATGKVIVLNFTDFNLDSVPVDNWCDESYAYVKIVDQSGSSIYCGREAPPILVSSSNTVLVYFKSGYGYSRGFRAYYESVQTVDSRGIFETRSTSMPHQPQVPPVATERSYSCGGNLGGPSGIIGAPEYHEGYWLEVHCRWNVTVNPGWIIVLNFTTFNLDSTPVDGQCDERYAHIKVVDGDTSVSIFCGQNKPRTVISIGRTLIIEFFSNLEINRFFATYAAVKSDDKMLSPRFISAAPLKSTAPSVSEGLPKESVTHRQFFPCGGFLSRPSGEIYSPRFKEQPLEKRVSCQWNITVSEQWIIALNFTYFDLDSVPMIGNMCDERYDHVSIADGEGEGRASTQLFCGQNNPGVFVSSTNKLIITFLTYFGYGRGFSASYSRVRPESSIIATVHPPRVVSASADVPSTSLQPEPPYECGGNLIGPNGAIQSPNIPEEYVSSVTCTWNITVQLGSIIELSFVTFMLDSVPINNQCDLRYAHMNIFDGKREAVHAKHVYCGQDLPGIFFSSSNTMTVEFVSNYGHGGEFYLSYMSSKAGSQLLDPRLLPVSSHPFSTQEPSQLMVTEKPTKLCGGTLNSPHGVIQFPNIFAGFQGQAINCHWTIRVQSGKVIALDFTFFNLDSVPVNNLCDEMYANVKVIDGEDARSSFKVFCGQDLPPSFVSSMNTLVIIFNDLQGYSEGFRAQYSSVTATVPISPSLNRQLLTPMTQTDASQTSCNSILKETSGVFSSPDYPNMYPADTFCSWIITTADNSRFIALKFLDFDVDNPMLEQDCSTHYSYVVVHHQNLSGREESHLFCGSHQPEIITPRAHQLIVEFYSNLGIGHGFQAAYQMYNQSEDGLQLDWSRLIEGPRDGVTTPVLSLSSTAIDGGYSEMSAPRGIVTSPNYPEQFPQGFYKTWIIRPSEGTYVTLAFEDVDFDVQTDDSYCSTLDTHVVLTIYSLEDERSDIIICQNVLSEGVISYGGLKLEFRSFFGVGRGFKARYASGMLNGDEGEDVESKPTTVPGLGVTDGRVDIKTVEWSSAIKSTITTVGTHPGESSCDELLSNTEGIIGSPNFPLSMPQDTECSWTILLPGNQGIQLEFLDFALDDQSELDSATCRQDSASVSVVMDGNLYKFCGNTVPSPMTSSGNTVGIVFKSKSGKGAGFRMHYVDASLRSTASDQPRGGTDAATTLSIPGRRASVPTNLPTASSPTQATEGETNSKSNGVTPLSITSLNVSAPESDHSDVEVRFLGNDAITDTPDDVGKDNFTRPGRERVNVPVSPPPEPATVPASPTPQQDFEFGAVATTGLDQTVSEEMSVLLPRHTDQPKVTGMGSTDPGAADITNHQLRVTTYVCVGVAVVLFIILVILTSICIYKRKQRHASKSIVLGHTEKSYWQNYKSWAADYSGGPGRSSRAATAGDIDEEGEEAEDMLKQERLV